jgi:hypothetical protein
MGDASVQWNAAAPVNCDKAEPVVVPAVTSAMAMQRDLTLFCYEAAAQTK